YLFPVADMFRNSLNPSAKSQNPLASMLSGDFDSFAQITNATEFVAVRGHTWGQQMLGVIFFWVPRSFWPGKAIDTGSMLADMKMYSFRNLSAPLWAEFFIDGGWILLVGGMLVLGVVLRQLDASGERALQVSGTPGLVGCILPFYMLLLLRGSLLQSMALLSIVLVTSAFVRPRTEKPTGPVWARPSSPLP
ncbi:MAG: hypothetical protein JWN70_6658, partial [Planctomycetaceae bacterium]|nr:hypothetical protein [Planctomycetaceae bacterium]